MTLSLTSLNLNDLRSLLTRFYKTTGLNEHRQHVA
jgi:hypothetical protein